MKTIATKILPLLLGGILLLISLPGAILSVVNYGFQWLNCKVHNVAYHPLPLCQWLWATRCLFQSFYDLTVYFKKVVKLMPILSWWRLVVIILVWLVWMPFAALHYVLFLFDHYVTNGIVKMFSVEYEPLTRHLRAQADWLRDLKEQHFPFWAKFRGAMSYHPLDHWDGNLDQPPMFPPKPIDFDTLRNDIDPNHYTPVSQIPIDPTNPNPSIH